MCEAEFVYKLSFQTWTGINTLPQESYGTQNSENTYLKPLM